MFWKKSNKHSFIHGIQIASPCSASWDAMEGDDRARFCGQCKLNVYNISAMSTAEAEKLISEREGRLCVQFFRRADGTILTEDCPRGLRAIRDRWLKCVAGVAGLISVCAAYLINTVPAERFNEVLARFKGEAEQTDASHEGGKVLGALSAEYLVRGEMQPMPRCGTGRITELTQKEGAVIPPPPALGKPRDK